MTHAANAGIDHIRRTLAPLGFDLVRPFSVGAYNQLATSNRALSPLRTFGRSDPLGVLVGNTRTLWPVFLAALREDPTLGAAADPLDLYTSRCMNRCAGQLPAAADVHLSHLGGRALVSMLHVAQLSGLADVGPAHLAVHPQHGPWFGLRAVLVVDTASVVDPSEPGTPPVCAGCDAPCRGAMKQALHQTEDLSRGGVASSWRAWLAVRDACPVGRRSRYPESQILYHYTKNRERLREAAGLEESP